MTTQLEKREPTDAELRALFGEEEEQPSEEVTDEELAALFSGEESEEAAEPTDDELMALLAEEPRPDGEPTDDELMALFAEEEVPEMSGIDQAAAAAGKFTEWSLGIGDELGAFGSAMGGSVYDVFNSDKSMGEIIGDNFQWSRNIDNVRANMDRLEEANPALNNAAAIAGGITGLAVPAATLGKASALGKVGMAATEGAVYGAASGREAEGRLAGAGIGAATGGVVGAGIIKGGKMLQDRAARKADEAALNQELGEALGTTVDSKGIAVEQPRMSDEGFPDTYELPMDEVPTRREYNLNTGDDAVDEAASSILEDARVIREAARRGDEIPEAGIPSDKTAKEDFQQPSTQSPKDDFTAPRDDLYLTAPQVQQLDEALGTNNAEFLDSLTDALEEGSDGITVRELKDFMALRGTDDANELLGDVLLDGIADNPDQITGFMRAFRSILRPKSRQLEKNVGRGFSSAVDRGLIRGMRANAKVDEVLGAGGVTGRLNSLFVDNDKFAAAVLNQSNAELPIQVRQANYDNARAIAQANGIDNFDDVMQKVAESTNIATQHAGKNYAKVFSTFDNTSGLGKPQYMHVATAPDRVIGKTPGVHVEEGVRAEGALKEAVRGVVKPDEVGKFASPFESHRQFLSNLNNQTELARALHLRVAGVGGKASDLNSVVSGKYMDKAIAERLRSTGAYSPEQIELAVDGVKDVTVRAEKAMAAELQALRDVTYYGLLAKPFSAVLNLAEMGNAAITQGFGNTAKAAVTTTMAGMKSMPHATGKFLGWWDEKLGTAFSARLQKAFPNNAKIEAFDAEVQGLIQSVQNDVVKSLPTGSETIPGAAAASRTTRKLLNWGMKYSGTKTIDLGVKETTLRAAFNRGRAAMKAKSPKGRQAFIRENRRFFSDEELHLLMDSLKRVTSAKQVGEWANSSNPALQRRADLIMDYNMLQLKEMQPVAPSDLPEWALRHPAGRSLYTFLNFSIKQAEFIEKRTIDAVKQGRYADAAKFTAAYIIITGGLTSTIMEGRDAIWKGQPFDWVTPTNKDGTPSESDTAGSVLSRMIPWGLSTFSSGILPHTPYGMDKFLNDPWGETLDDRLVGYKGVYDNLRDDARDLTNKGKFPSKTARMATPWGRPAEALMEHVWETTGMGELAKKEFGVNKNKYLERIGQPIQED